MTRSSALPRRAVLSGLLLGTLGACTGTGRFHRPAGAVLDEGGFGDPTMRNMLIMSGDVAAGRIGNRFAASVPTTVTFPFDSAHLTPEARAVLDQQAHFMRRFPEVRFSVYGHTDLVGSDAYNEGLGRRRARAVVSYLTGRGVDLSRLDALVSFGEQRPLVPVQGREQANRRTVTEVAGFVQDHPMVLDGKYGQIVYRSYVGSAGGEAAGDAGGDA